MPRPHRPAPADLADHAHLNRHALARHYGKSEKIVAGWLKETGLGRKSGSGFARAIPDDFADHASLPNAVLKRRYSVGETLLLKWRKAIGLSPSRRRPRGLKPIPEGFHQFASVMSLPELQAKYNAGEATVRRWRKEIGAKGLPHRKSRHPRQLRNPTPGQVFIAQANNHAAMKAGREEEAAQHLRRFCAVYRCGERGGADTKGGFWRVGNAVLTAAELMERAVRRGWDPDAWSRLAA